MTNEIKISAIVVGRNESKKLGRCLASLGFCNEILYGDLNSNDNSIEIAESFNCKVFHYKEFGPSCEYTQTKLIELVKNDWTILVDPDEVLDLNLQNSIIEILPEIEKKREIGAVSLPWAFYFGRTRLKGTPWGGDNRKVVLVNKTKFEILPITHYGRRVKEGFQIYEIKKNNTGSNVLHHFWMDNWSMFINKHVKYLKDEGEDRYKMGRRTNIKNIILGVYREFKFSFKTKKGYKDGFLGLLLSLFWVWYNTTAEIQLLKVQKKGYRNI